MRSSADEGDFGGRDGHENIAAPCFIEHRIPSSRISPHSTETTL
jgi:hypothetical protein